MSRWEPDAPQRLAQAAIELFSENGYTETSVIDIAQRAGLAKSTFFRHFASKREVLFGEDLMSQVLNRAIESAPARIRPFDVMAQVILVLEECVFTSGYRDVAARRRAVIEEHSDLQEREALKMTHLADGAARAFHERCDPQVDARLAAQLCMFVIGESYERWAVYERADSQSTSFAVTGRCVLDDVRAGVLEL